MPKKKKVKTWDKIGDDIGKKIEKSCDSCSDNGFFGRTLFIIGLLIALNTLGIINEVSIWVQILIGAGFAFMKFG